MVEDLREDILAILESRVTQAIDVIQELRKQNEALDVRVDQLESEIERLDEIIVELKDRNAELLHFEEEIQRLRHEREQEIQRVETERTQIRARVEGILQLLNQAEVDEE